jgi:DNA-binding XRE family transcriptional regulator
LLSAKELGSMARERREALHRSQKDIAKALSVSQTTLHKLETGIVDESKHWPRLFTLLELPLEKLDPIYARLTTGLTQSGSTLHVAGHGAAHDEAHGARVKVTIEHEAIAIVGIRYSTAQTADGPAMLITWVGRNGEELDGLMDRAMVEDSIRRFFEKARKLGIDPAKLLQASHP